MRTGGYQAIEKIREDNPKSEIRVVDGETNVSHRAINEATQASGPIKSFFKKKGYIEMTEKKRDGNKLSQELTYQFSPRYKAKKDEILKPSPHQPPKVYHEG